MNSTTIPIEQTEVFHSFGYIPTKSTCYVFLVLFAVSAIIHIGQSIFSRRYWLIPTAALCCALEAGGWGTRLSSALNPMNNMGFKVQMVLTVTAPTPLLAINFIIVGQVITLLGPQYSRLSAKYYSIVFLTCDILSLVIQGAGGGLAATADDPTVGGHIMLGGIAFQTFAITLFCIVTLEFFWRHQFQRPVRFGGNVPTTNGIITKKLLVLCVGLVFNTFCLYVRAVYRLLELGQGWHGAIIETQWLFNVFDGTMIVLAVYTWNFIHPMFWLPDTTAAKSDVEKEMNEEG
ncbi:RTA1-domain-containing protein [Flagelloscypha sp. PMI_526]|nr:RTA1-domain-containing protein [Flagelloscypha sp. PMI_526]